MTWFLRLFVVFKALESANADMEGMIRARDADLERLTEHADASDARLREVEIRLVGMTKLSEELTDKLAAAESRARDAKADLTFSRNAYNEIRTERMLLQDRLDAAISDRENLWEMAREAQAAKDFAYQTQINHAVQKAGGGIPYPSAHSLPSGSVAPVQAAGPVGRRGRMLSSQVQDRYNAEFIRNGMAAMQAHEEG